MQTVQFMQENLGSLRLEDLRKPSKRERLLRARLEKREAQIAAEKYALMTEEEKLQAEMDGMGLAPAGSSMAKLSNAPSSKMTNEHPGATPPLAGSKQSLHDKESKQSKSQLSQKSKEEEKKGRDKEARGGARPSRVSKAFKRQETVRAYRPGQQNLAPAPTMRSGAMQKPAAVRHASVIDLKYAKER